MQDKYYWLAAKTGPDYDIFGPGLARTFSRDVHQLARARDHYERENRY